MSDMIENEFINAVSQRRGSRGRLMTEREYDKLIAAISGHFLTQELPDNWRDFSLEYLEEFITESATDSRCTITYEYWHWAGLLSLIEEVAHTVKEFMEKETNQ